MVPKGCKGYKGPNLKCHLINVHFKKNTILEREVDRYFFMGLDGRNKRGPLRKTKSGKPLRGRWKRCCPQPDCSYLGAYLPEHLRNAHRMKPSGAHYKLCLKVAKRYKGLVGELETMEQPEPVIVELNNPPSPLPSHSPSPPASPPAKRAKKSTKPSPLDSDEEDVIPPKPDKRPASAARAAPAPPAAPSGSSATPAPTPSGSEDQEGDDDDEAEYPLVADFFEEKNPKTNRHKWLIHYYRHLFTPDAGFHKDKNRLQHALQVKHIMETDPRGHDITFMAEEEGSRIWLDWVVPNLKSKKPGRLKSNLTSLEICLTFVTKKGS